MGKAATLDDALTGVSKKREETDSFFAAFGRQLKEEPEPDTIIDIEIWTANKDMYEIYKVLQKWTNENGVLSPELARDLIKGRKLPLEETLDLLPYIHFGYCKIINTEQESTNGRENPQD